MRLSLAAVALTCASLVSATAQRPVLPLWPHATPEPAQTTEPEKDVTVNTDKYISGHRTARLTNVTQPTLTVYAPPANMHFSSAALVFPGGAYQRLAWDGEGVDTCHWFNSLGMTCILVKYRVPEKGHYPDNLADLEDAQQAMRITRAHAAEWHINPNKIGVVGFSAGGHLAATLSTHWDDRHVESTPAAADVDVNVSARPAFDLLGYPAYLYSSSAGGNNGDDSNTVNEIDPALIPVPYTPPTFIVQNEDDATYIESALVYYQALRNAKIPAELHLFAIGGHGFGMYPTGIPAHNWTLLAADWLRSIHMIPSLEAMRRAARNQSPGNGPAGTIPCPAVIPQPGPRPTPQPQPPTGSTNPNCW